jgi:hypothetical protein
MHPARRTASPEQSRMTPRHTCPTRGQPCRLDMPPNPAGHHGTVHLCPQRHSRATTPS